jgi:hypothetical protein
VKIGRREFIAFNRRTGAFAESVENRSTSVYFSIMHAAVWYSCGAK